MDDTLSNSTSSYNGSTANNDVRRADDNDNIRTADVAMTVLYVIIGIVGVTGNALVIVVTCRYSNLKKKNTYLLIIHQSVIDLISSVLLLVQLVSIKRYTNLDWWLGKVFCRLWISTHLLWNLFTVSTYNLVAIAVERHFAIVHAVWYKQHFTSTHVRIMMALVWLVGSTTNVYTIATSAVVYGRCYVMKFWGSPTVATVVGLVNICVKFFIPLTVMTVCYTRIILVLRKNAGPVHGNVNTNSNIARAKRNVIKTLVIVSGAFVFCWCWNQMYFLAFLLGLPSDFTSSFYHFTTIMVNVNCCINPLVYVFKFEEFRTGLRKFLSRRPRQVGDEAQATNSTPITVSQT